MHFILCIYYSINFFYFEFSISFFLTIISGINFIQISVFFLYGKYITQKYARELCVVCLRALTATLYLPNGCQCRNLTTRPLFTNSDRKVPLCMCACVWVRISVEVCVRVYLIFPHTQCCYMLNFVPFSFAVSFVYYRFLPRFSFHVYIITTFSLYSHFVCLYRVLCEITPAAMYFHGNVRNNTKNHDYGTNSTQSC